MKTEGVVAVKAGLLAEVERVVKVGYQVVVELEVVVMGVKVVVMVVEEVAGHRVCVYY